MVVVDLVRFENHVLPVVDSEGGRIILITEFLHETLRNDSDASKPLKKLLRDTKEEHGAKLRKSSLSMIDRVIADYFAHKVIETTSDLGLKAGWDVVEGVIDEGDDISKHIVVVRPSAKSDIAYLYLSPAVSGNDDLVDAYKQIKSSVELLDWCVETRNLRAKETVIAAIYQQRKLRSTTVTDSQRLSKSRTNGRELLVSAIERGASDIHITYFSDAMGSVMFRIDKRLVVFNEYSSEDLLSMIRTIYMDGTNVGGIGFNERQPQEMDITFSTSIGGATKSFTLRWQSMPKDGGLKVVLRILDNDPTSIQSLSFQGMGYADQHQTMIKMATANKKGFILTTGTTGSGKSTTNLRAMYEMLINNPHWSFYTVEDPIEYRIDGVCQIPVQASYVEGSSDFDEQTRRKMAFMKILNGLMRQDPDVIGIGEVRDETTAKIVEDFVNTGHKMIATLHADSALFVFDRLNSIGISKDTLCRPGFFSLIIYQTLQPKVCRYCSLPLNKGAINKEQRNSLEALLNYETDRVRVHNPDGCEHCNRGLKGMTVCAEILQPDNTLLQHIRNNDYVSAEKYWLNDMPPVDRKASFQGKNIVDHMIYKVKNGELCPVICMEEFSDFTQILRSGRDFSFLHTVKVLKHG